jgi:HTH-type transcriptional regulator/antitoxin HigA
MTLNLAELIPAWQRVHALAPAAFSPLADENSYDQALETLEALMMEIGEDATHPLEDLARALVERIVAYEDRVYPLPDVPPARMLAHLMELRGVTQRALAEATGIDQGNISKLLSGKRSFSTEHLRVLSAYFKVDPSLFL